MKLNLLRFSILKLRVKHIFLLSFILIAFETGFSSYYAYTLIRSHAIAQANHLVTELLQIRLLFLNGASQSIDLEHNIQLLQHQDPSHNIFIQLSPQADLFSEELPANIPIPADSLYHTWTTQLNKKHSLSLITYLPQASQWLTLQANFSESSNWQNVFIYLLYDLLLVATLWLVFFLYCRYALPEELFQRTIPSHSDESSSRVVQNLKQQLHHYLEEKNLMLGALAHDIKTPLTEALLRLELIENPSVTEGIRQSLHKIDKIVKSSLEYAQQMHQIRTERIELVSLLESIADSYQESGFKVEFIHSMEELELPLELELFRRMVVNLLENAKKYATMATITLEQTNDHITLIFSDNGPGVPQAFLHLLGVPYFRVDPSRSSQSGGSGLGLSIVKKIVSLHLGSVTFSNILGGGFQATIHLSLSQLEQLHQTNYI